MPSMMLIAEFLFAGLTKFSVPIPVGLTIVASLSPLLTFAYLWQLKEWRIDRLHEQLQREGWLQLFGRLRLPIVGLYLFGFTVILLIKFFEFNHIYDIANEAELHMRFLNLITLIVLAIVSIGQLLLGRRRFPVPTKKALILSAITLLVLIGLMIPLIKDDLFKAYDFRILFYLPFLPILQPFLFFIAWLLFYPIDRLMKGRIMNRAKALRSQFPNLTVIGITGSVGKTTTKEMLAHLLHEKSPLTTPAHVNTDIGVSQWLIKILSNIPNPNPKPLTLIVEMGAYKKGEIKLLCDIAQPTMGIISRIGEEHLALFGSKQAIIEGKSELYASLPQTGHAFLNKDSEGYELMMQSCICKTTSVSEKSDADLKATDISESPEGIKFTVNEHHMFIPIQGLHNVTNALLAIACARSLGIAWTSIQQHLKTFTLQEHTFNIRTERGITILDATYNSSPQSFEAAIEWAAKQPQKKKILLTSGIIELGSMEAGIHRSLAVKARTVFDQAYIVSSHFFPYFHHSSGWAETIRNAKPLEKGTLLVCIGRIPSTIIQSLMPS